MAQTLTPAARRPKARGSRRLLAVRGDDHLVARVRAGDEVAFEVVYDRYAPVLLSFCRHMLGRQDEAEDAVQQVFVSAHDGLLRDERRVELKPWLYAIARNRCLSVIRGRRELPGAEVDAPTRGLQEQIQGRADLREMLADLAGLPEKQRAALLLTELEDLSHADAASVLDCEASQVKGLVFRARAGLIERRDARLAPCEEIREELATARRGTLRKGRLRHHLDSCPGCTAYLEEVRRQRTLIALLLPVVPATGLKRSVLAAAGIGAGSAGGGALTVAGGSAVTATVAKIAAAGVLAGGAAGLAGHRLLDDTGSADPNPPPAADVLAPRSDRSAAAPASKPVGSSPSGGPTRAPRAARPTPGPGATRKPRPASAKGRNTSRSARGAAPPGLASRPASGPRRARPATPPKARGPQRATKPPANRGGTRAHGTPAPQAGPKSKPPKKTK